MTRDSQLGVTSRFKLEARGRVRANAIVIYGRVYNDTFNSTPFVSWRRAAEDYTVCVK